jgi:transcription elongation factor/antiterminator RfaH
MTRWYVVHTQPQAEARALWHLENQGFCCFLPRVVELKRHARQVRPVLAPLFPRYLFIRFDVDVTRWRAINGTRGVVSLLANGPCPLPVPAGVVESLLTKCDRRGAAPLTAMGVFTEGVRVRIKSGAFSGQTGEITKVLAQGGDRVHVLLTLLGVQTDLRLPSYAIEAA